MRLCSMRSCRARLRPRARARRMRGRGRGARRRGSHSRCPRATYSLGVGLPGRKTDCTCPQVRAAVWRHHVHHTCRAWPLPMRAQPAAVQAGAVAERIRCVAADECQHAATPRLRLHASATVRKRRRPSSALSGASGWGVAEGLTAARGHGSSLAVAHVSAGRSGRRWRRSASDCTPRGWKATCTTPWRCVAPTLRSLCSATSCHTSAAPGENLTVL